MKVYADRPLRYSVQLLSDLFALALTGFAVWLAIEVHTQVMRLQGPGNGLIDAGSGLRGTFDSAADHADDVPLAGAALAKALHTGSAAGAKLTDAGRSEVAAIGDLAWWLAFLLIAIPVSFLLLTWLPLRWRFARRATAAMRLRELGDDGLDVLALRALVTHPLARPTVAADLTAGWRDRDPDALRQLAGWELARHGLRS